MSKLPHDFFWQIARPCCLVYNYLRVGLAYGLTEAMISIATILAPVLAGLLYAKNPVAVYAVSFFLILISIIAGAVFSPHTQNRAAREKGALVKLS